MTTHPENVASQRVAEKAGFERLGPVDDYVLPSGARATVVFALRA